MQIRLSDYVLADTIKVSNTRQVRSPGTDAPPGNEKALGKRNAFVIDKPYSVNTKNLRRGYLRRGFYFDMIERRLS